VFGGNSRAYTEINVGGGGERSATFFLPPPLGAPKGDKRAVYLKHMASWISGISTRYFKGTQTVQLPIATTALSSLQTKLLEKNIVSKKSTFYYTVKLVIIGI